MKVTAQQVRSLRELAKARTNAMRLRWWARVNLGTLRALRDKKLVENSAITDRGRDVLAGASVRRRSR